MDRNILLTVVSLTLVATSSLGAQSDADNKPMGSRPRILVGTLDFPDENLLQFAERVKPEFVVMGAFGAPQWVRQKSMREWIGKWKAIFDRMHQADVKVVGMIELLNVGNTPAEAEKFVDFFDNHWETAIFGRKPAVKGASLLERRAMPPEMQSGAHAPRGCANNRNWRAVEKALVKAMIDAGIDGFITHRNMFGECGCPFCHADWNKADKALQRHRNHQHKQPQAIVNVHCDHCAGGLRRWLAERYDNDQLREKFSIKDIKTHKFQPIYGHHTDHEKLPAPIELEAMKYARHAVKETFDEVFVAYGKSLKSDLIIAQWNHMPYFDELHLDMGHIPRWHMTTFAHASADERWSLPIELWGRGEDFYWYCNWGTCQNTQLDKRFLADVTLYAKLLRSMARGKPYLINKYDFYRPRNMLAEAAALGMIPGAIAVPRDTKADADVMARYFEFFRKHDSLYQGNNGEAVSEVLIVYPRLVTHGGDAGALEMIEVAGRTLITEHIQFDMVPDDLLSKTDLGKYRAVVVAESHELDEEQFASYTGKRGKLIAVPRTNEKAANPFWRMSGATIVKGLKPHTGGSDQAAPFLTAVNRALGMRQMTFDAPYTVEPHVYRQPGRYVVHLVNYNHTEKAKGTSHVAREAPLAAAPVNFSLQLGDNVRVKRVLFHDPDAEHSREIKHRHEEGVLSTTTPVFLVYGVCVIELIE